MVRAVRQFEKEVSFKLGTGVENVTSNCMGRAVRQFDKEVSFNRLETGVGYVTPNCMGRAVRQFDKKVIFKLGKGVEMLHRSVWDAPFASLRKEVSFKP